MLLEIQLVFAGLMPIYNFYRLLSAVLKCDEKK